jgi:hypothetical protein
MIVRTDCHHFSLTSPITGRRRLIVYLIRADFAAPVHRIVRRQFAVPDDLDITAELALGQFVLDQ